jgi:hypothetical protein
LSDDDERFDNLNQVIARVSTGLEKLRAAAFAPDDEPDDLRIARIATAAASYGMDSARAIAALATMLAVVAAKTDMMWMVDGPGLPIAGLANKPSQAADDITPDS